MTDPYATGVLVKEHHDRLVANLDEFARDAGIQPKWVWTKLADVCGPDEIEYFRAYRRHRAGGEVQGLIYLRGTPEADPEARMAALAGAFVRNFVRARVMTLATVMDQVKAGGVDATVLLIPNFCLSPKEGGVVAKWQTQILYDLLLQRSQSSQQTILYATDVKELEAQYGSALARFIERHYEPVEI